MIILADIAKCYINLHMYEDSLEYANKAIKWHAGKIPIYYKAVSLAHLHSFEESIETFNSITLVDLSNETELVN